MRNQPDEVTTRLDLAEYYRLSDQPDKISELLSDLQPRYPFDDKETRGRYNFLVAFGHAHDHRFVEAEEAARRGLEESPQALDFLYVLTYVHLALREFDKVTAAARTFIEVRDSVGESTERPPFCSTADDISQVHNFLGAAYEGTGRSDDAIPCYRQAIDADGGNHLPYLNLVRLLDRLDRRGEARAVIERGLTACRQVQELRLLSATYENRSTISACLMVKNEEELLPQCLDSIRHWVDEIIVVDTGSSDRTVEVAQSYGARIFHQPWEGNFSKHRNYSVEQATGDWILIIDADECIDKEDIGQIRQLLTRSEHRVISINVYNVGGKNEETVTFLPSVRFFKRELGLKYEGIVHNLLKVPPDEPILRTGVRLKHYGYGLSAEKMKSKFERSRALLEKQLEEAPDNYYAHFHYAQLLRGQGLNDHPEFAPLILKAAHRALELSNPDDPDSRHVHLMALHQVAWVQFITGNYPEASTHCHRALEHKADYLDPMLLLGHIALRSGDCEQAKKHYQRYLDAQAQYNPAHEIDSLILLHPQSRESALYGLGTIALDEGRFDVAAEYFQDTLRACPGFLDTDTRLGWTYLRLHRLEDAQACFQRALEADDANAEAVVG
ncbi:MAG: glycosyltransferase, partial [Planctomycetota bacterium]